MLPSLKQKKTMVRVYYKTYPNNGKGHSMFNSVRELEARFSGILPSMNG